MNDQSDITKALAGLIRETQDGGLVWKATTPPGDLAQGAEIVTIVYCASRGPRLLRLFPFKTKVYIEPDVGSWTDGCALEVSDDMGQAWWRFPEHPIVTDLLEAVRFKTVGVGDFIDSVLSAHKDRK